MSLSLLYADPPWPQNKGGLRSVRPKQKTMLDYPVMPLHEIKAAIASVDAQILFLWSIDKFLHEAELMAESLGFRLHARIVWDKLNGVAPAFTIRFSHEYLLWFYKQGFLMSGIPNNVRGKFRSVICEAGRNHSRKPDAAYEFIESLYPNATKTEMFGRYKRQGWKQA